MYDNPTSTSRALIGLRPRFAKYLTTILHGRYAASNYILIAIGGPNSIPSPPHSFIQKTFKTFDFRRSFPP